MTARAARATSTTSSAKTTPRVEVDYLLLGMVANAEREGEVSLGCAVGVVVELGDAKASADPWRCAW
jgi:hypothetical protein